MRGGALIFFGGVGALDYHPGHVLPFAINLWAAQYADDSKIVLPKCIIFFSVQKLSNIHKGTVILPYLSDSMLQTSKSILHVY